MAESTRDYALGTSVTYRLPWGVFVSARVMCADGRVRKTSRLAVAADTFFSVPASVRVNGKTVSGYLTIETASGSSVETEEDPSVAKFARYDYGRNASELPKGTYRAS